MTSPAPLKQALGLLLVSGPLTDRALTVIQTALSSDAPGNQFTEQSARDLEARAIAAGVSCYVRNWHAGDVGWFVIRSADYSRVLESQLGTGETGVGHASV